MRCLLTFSALVILGGTLVEAVSVYYCNSSYFAQVGTGMVDGMFLFDTVPSNYSFFEARDACKTWPFPVSPRDFSFVSTDVMITSPQSMKPSLASLWSPQNFEVWVNYLYSSGQDFWIGLGQNNNLSSCPSSSSSISTVYETSWNWTWLDGTPLLRDSKGQGLVFFASGEPSNSDGIEHYGSSWNWGSRGLNDLNCNWKLRAICSIPRKKSMR
jgi:hypothetical protein